MKFAIAFLLTTSLMAAPAAAVAGPTIPTDCHSLNKLLHIDNVRDCDNGS